MKKIRWLYNRFRRMSVSEVLKFRIPQFIQIQVLGYFQKKKNIDSKKIIVNKNYKPPIYSLDKMDKLIEGFSYQYSFFDMHIDLNQVNDWRRDFKNDKTSKLKYYGKINRQDFEEYGDVKYVSELSRFHFFPFIAFKYISTKEEEFSNTIKKILLEWGVQNPYLCSINWTSGIEVGVRSVNLIYTHQILKSAELLSNEIDKLIKAQIGLNYHYLKNNLSLYSSANNHLIGELLGLVAISNYFSTSDFNSTKWNHFFLSEFRKQINEDGVDMELSTRYHATVTEHFLNGFEFMKNAGIDIPNDIINKFKKMFDLVNHTVLDNTATCFGDDDNSKLIYPYFDNNFSIYKSLLQSSNHLFNTNYNSDKLDSRNYLIFGNRIKSNKILANYEDILFSKSGYCFMYDDKTKIGFDVGAIGDELLAAHGHSDLLHFTFESNNTPYIVDCGTYQYHENELFFRNYFKGISAHNTISINNKNHAISNGRMGWANNPKTRVLESRLNSENSFCLAEHNAFSDDGVVHRRKIELDKKNKIVKIHDDLKKEISSNETMFSFYLHFHPCVTVKHSENIIKLIATNGNELILENPLFNQAEIIKGNKSLPLGWYSQSYDEIQPTSTLKLNLVLQKNTTITTTINYFSA